MLSAKKTVAALLVTSMLTGCATVADGTRQSVRVSSDPAGAKIAVDCGDAPHHPRQLTPATLQLPRRADPCTLLVTKRGYVPRSISLRREWSPRAFSNFAAAEVSADVLDATCCDDGWWAFAGFLAGTSLILGGVALGVDRATGAIYQHSPDDVDVFLQPDSSSSTEEGDRPDQN